MKAFTLIIPEFNGTAVAKRYYQIMLPANTYDGNQAWRKLKQDKLIQKKVLQQVIDEFYDKQQKNIANYFADQRKELPLSSKLIFKTQKE
jgi:hypothetical protein